MEIIAKGYSRRPLLLFSVLSVFFWFWLSLVAVSFADSYTVTYQYDASSRLTGVQYSNGTTTEIEYTYDTAGNILTKKVVLRTGCTACSSSPVELTNVTFTSGTTCECSDDTSITIGTGVTIKSGANITFKAPTVKIQSGFHAETGSVVNIKQQ